MKPRTSFPVVVHPYRSIIRGSCCYEIGNPDSKNAIVFLGGLTDGPHTSPFLASVSDHLSRAEQLSYSIFEVRMRSAYLAYGTSSLVKDVEDISAVIEYLKGLGREKIVLVGHSTGCQDCMEYTNYAKHRSPRVDGFILLAPVSDRESLDIFFPDHEKSVQFARKWIEEGKGDECLPSHVLPAIMSCPVTAYRLHSLCAPGGDDDYFSSDLSDEFVRKVWGRFREPVLILHAELDEFVPPHVCQAALNKRYQESCPSASKLSGLVTGAGHTFLDEECRARLSNTIIEFLEGV